MVVFRFCFFLFGFFLLFSFCVFFLCFFFVLFFVSFFSVLFGLFMFFNIFHFFWGGDSTLKIHLPRSLLKDLTPWPRCSRLHRLWSSITCASWSALFLLLFKLCKMFGNKFSLIQFFFFKCFCCKASCFSIGVIWSYNSRSCFKKQIAPVEHCTHVLKCHGLGRVHHLPARHGSQKPCPGFGHVNERDLAFVHTFSSAVTKIICHVFQTKSQVFFPFQRFRSYTYSIHHFCRNRPTTEMIC